MTAWGRAWAGRQIAFCRRQSLKSAPQAKKIWPPNHYFGLGNTETRKHRPKNHSTAGNTETPKHGTAAQGRKHRTTKHARNTAGGQIHCQRTRTAGGTVTKWHCRCRRRDYRRRRWDHRHRRTPRLIAFCSGWFALVLSTRRVCVVSNSLALVHLHLLAALAFVERDGGGVLARDLYAIHILRLRVHVESDGR